MAQFPTEGETTPTAEKALYAMHKCATEFGAVDQVERHVRLWLGRVSLSADYRSVPSFAAAIAMASSAVAMTAPIGLALVDASALPAGYL